MIDRQLRLHLLALAALVLATGAAALGAGSPAPAPGSAWWCGTYDWGIEEALARHDWNRRRLSREFAIQSTGGSAQSLGGPTVRQEGNVAVIEDDGTIVAARNVFDYQQRGVRFLRRKQTGFKLRRLGGALRAELGEKLALADDDAVRVSLPGFQVRFYGQRYDAVYINSDGNLTFGRGDRASTPRDIQRLLNGPPRVAPFLADLNPQTAPNDGGVYRRFAGNKLIVTWWKVPEFGTLNSNTFQIILYASGKIDVRFGSMDAREGIVGVAPGGGGGLELIDLTEDLPIKRFDVAIAEQFRTSETLDEASAAAVFFQHFADDYDQLVLFTEFLSTSPGTIAYHLTVQNPVHGIGTPVYDASRFFGSRGRLQGFVNMGRITKYSGSLGRVKFLDAYSSLDVLAHELGHQWLVRATFVDDRGRVSEDLLGRGSVHWSFYFDSDLSFMEGNEIRDNGDGSFTTLSRRAGFNPLDLYLMGLISAAEVPDKFYVAFASGPDPDEVPAAFGVTFVGQRIDVTMDRILASLGPRRPTVDSSPKDFKIGFILLGRSGEPPSAASISRVGEFAAEIERLFRRSTGRLATIDTTLIPW